VSQKNKKIITDTAWTQVGHGSDTLETRTELESPKKSSINFQTEKHQKLKPKD
jgi:hypothetical protein